MLQHFLELIIAIKSKLVDPVKPYNKEQPYNNNPDDKST